LFSNRLDNNVKTEIVLLITPRIVRNIKRPDAEITEFASGTEASLGAAAASAGVSFGAPYVPPAPIIAPQIQSPAAVPLTAAPGIVAPGVAPAIPGMPAGKTPVFPPPITSPFTPGANNPGANPANP